MTNDEAAAIQLYTQHCCLYPMLNAALRDHTHPENLTAFKPYLKLFLTALNKLPLVRANVYRGVKGDLHETYDQLQGQVFRWWAFSSTTPRESQAETFLGEGERTLFVIDAVGVDISAFSVFYDEREVLILPGTCLVVKPGVMVKPNYWKVEASVWQATNDSGILAMPVARFQDTDMAHPGWEDITSAPSSENPLPPTPHSTPSTEAATVCPQV